MTGRLLAQGEGSASGQVSVQQQDVGCLGANQAPRLLRVRSGHRFDALFTLQPGDEDVREGPFLDNYLDAARHVLEMTLGSIQ
jgi:hypothetical protein